MSVWSIITTSLEFLGGSIVLVILGIFLGLHYQEEIQKYSVVLWKGIRIFWRKADKRIVANDIQGRVNRFAKSLSKEMTDFESVGVQIQWIEEGESPSEFFNDGRLIIRMREHQNQNKNFVSASMVFITTTVLTKAKKYISKAQKESLDLFIGRKLFEKEKRQVAEQFFVDFFSPKMDTKGIADLVEKYNLIDKVALFFPVLVQELSFLGEKVFWKRRDAKITTEVNYLIDFLEDYANRELGEEMPGNFEGAYCRCGIMIVSKLIKRELGDIQPYVRHIERLLDKKIENVYIIGPAARDNVRFITQVVQNIEQKGLLEIYGEPRIHKAQIKSGGKRIAVDSYILLLRNPEPIRYFDKEYQQQFIEPSVKSISAIMSTIKNISSNGSA